MTMTAGALLFDLDGTLTDPRPGFTRCMRHALETIAAPVPSDPDLTCWIGPPLHRTFETYLGAERAHLVPRAVAAYRERYGTTGLFENSVYPGVAAGLHELSRNGRRLFVATSKPTVFAERILRHFELRQYFAGVYGSELSGERSDKRELIAHLLRSEAVPPQGTTMIGDRAYDMRGARSNAVRPVGALWGYGSREELEEAGAHELFTTVPELVLALRAE